MMKAAARTSAATKRTVAVALKPTVKKGRKVYEDKEKILNPNYANPANERLGGKNITIIMAITRKNKNKIFLSSTLL